MHATRAISGHSVPIIACLSSGASVKIRVFGPKSMGGRDIGPRIDAETARTGLSNKEIGPEVSTYFRIMSVDGLADVVFKFQRNIVTQKEN